MSVRPPTSLIVTALQHAQQNQLLRLRETTTRFLSLPRTGEEYNLYLQSVSHIPFRTPEATRTVKSILAQVDAQTPTKIAITTRTYTRLIRPSFSPVALLVYLDHRLSEYERRPWPLPILLSFLSAYSKLSNDAKADHFFAHIHRHPHTTPHILQHANTLRLAAQHTQHAAYHVLTSTHVSSSSLPHNSSASFHVLAKHLAVPAPSLIHAFLQLIHSLPRPPLRPLYTSLINGLILRKKYHSAVVFFNRLCKASPLDAPSLAAGINALTRFGQPHIAFQLLQHHYPPLLRPPRNNPSLPLISFLTALNRISRPDISTLLFFLYPSLYGPDSPPHSSLLLNLLLQASRTAFKMDQSIQSAKFLIPQNLERILLYTPRPFDQKSVLSKLNLRTATLLQQITASLGDNLSLRHLIAKPLAPFGKKHIDPSDLIYSHLGHPSRGGLRIYMSSSSYQSIPSITWAQIVFLRVLAGLGIGPSIQPPATSFIPSSPNPTPQPSLDSFTHLFTHRNQSSIPYNPTHYHNPSLWQNLLLPDSNNPFYPSIIPTNSNFFNYLVLLSLSPSLPTIHISQNGPHKLAQPNSTPLPPPSPHETPLVLAWMRTLSIQPSNSTLAIALVIWADVCAPQGKSGEGQYLALVDYLRDWVGEDRLPHWRTLQKWRGVVEKMRGGQEL